MQCSCGTDNAPHAKFCKGCGAPVQAASMVTEEQVNVCPSCATQLKLNAKFCGKCGHQFNVPASTPQSEFQLLKPQAVASIEHAINKQVALEPMPLVVNVNREAVETPPNNPELVQPARVEDVTAKVTAIPTVEIADTSGGNKKMMAIAAVLFFVAAVAGAGWYFILAPNNEVSVTEMAVAQTPADVALPVVPAAVAMIPDAPVTGHVSSPVSYLGKTVKIGEILDGYVMESEEQVENFKILQGVDDYRHKLILVTDMVGKVSDARNIPEIDKTFISSKEACVLNKKPYTGFYVVSSFKKLTTPSAIWKLAEDGKLVDETVANLECAAYSECEPESDVCFDIGYNEKRKQKLVKQVAVKQAASKPKVQAKKESAQKPEPSNTTQQHEPSATAIASTTTEPVHQQEVTQEEPKKKKKNFFETLEESVKNGATETTCTGAQRALNQCN